MVIDSLLVYCIQLTIVVFHHHYTLLAIFVNNMLHCSCASNLCCFLLYNVSLFSLGGFPSNINIGHML